MNIYRGEQRTPEWFDLKLGLFSGSGVYNLIGQDSVKKVEGVKMLTMPTKLTKGGKTYVMSKVKEKLYGKRKETPTTYAMEWGTIHEDTAAIEYMDKFGVWASRVGFYYNDDFGSSPDRLIDPGRGLLEIKCAPVKHVDYCLLKNQEDIYKKEKAHFWQMYMAMYCTQRQWCDFVAFDPRLEGKFKHLRLHVVRIHRQDFIMNRLINALKLACAYRDEVLKELGI